jgi:uncharacterized membrane protein
MTRSVSPTKFLIEEETSHIHVAVVEAERTTSAEIKVVLARHCWGDIKVKARRIFKKLGLDRTQQRNAVLLLFVVTNREFLIYGDEGIHAKVGQDFWDDVRDEMVQAFARDAFGDGIANGVRRIGEKLALHFPRGQDDVNEISNEIVYTR